MICEQTLGTCQTPEGEYTTTERETLGLMLRTHFPGSIILEDQRSPDQTILENKRGKREDWILSRKIITYEKVKWAIKTFKPFKSAGTDGIIPAMLKQGQDLLLPRLCTILRASLALKHIPEGWREALVVFIPKPGKTSYETPKSFRPICLTSFLLKTEEKLIEQYIREEVLPSRPLHRNQFAYQTGKSCESAIHEITQRAEESLDNREVALGAFLDIEGAFDNTSYVSINRSISNRNIEPLIGEWIKQMLTHRRARATLNNTTVRAKVCRGTPQGGVLSPLLWNLVSDSLLTRLETEGIYAVGYADDIVLLIRGSNTAHVFTKMQRALNAVENWCNEEELRVNPTKTTLVAFSRKRKLEPMRNLTFYGKTLLLKDEVKYLGITLDKKLTYRKHIENIANRATKTFMTCKRTFGKSWGLSPSMVQWVYTAMVRPIITYAALIWWHATKTRTVKQILGKIQRLACLGITGAMPTTPTAAMENILGIPPLHILIKAEALAGAQRFISNKAAVLSNIRHNAIFEELENTGSLSIRTDRTKAKHFNKAFISKRINAKEIGNQIARLRQEGNQIWYAEHKRRKTGVYAGIREVSQQGRQEILNLGKEITDLQAGIIAIQLGIQRMREGNPTGTLLSIITHEPAPIQALEAFEINSKAALECLSEITALADAQNRITFIVMQGEGGNSAERWKPNFAVKEAENVLIGPEPTCGTTRESSRKNLINWIELKHKRYWEGLPGLGHSRVLLDEPYAEMQKPMKTYTRTQLRKAIGLITGHAPFKKHLNIMGMANDPLCRGCEEEDETPLHIMCHCEGFNTLRETNLGEAKLTPERIKSLPLTQLLRFIKATELELWK